MTLLYSVPLFAAFASALVVHRENLHLNDTIAAECGGNVNCVHAKRLALFADAKKHSKTSAGRARENLCIDGRIAPELVLYGPARASTTTFAENVVKSPQVVFGQCKGEAADCPGEGWKEMHFFVDWDGSDQGRQKYLGHFPKCTQQNRLVAADLTPGQHVRSSGILEKLEKFYGDKADKVSFVMLLRDPIKCMQSFYHFEKQDEKRSFGAFCQLVLKFGAAGKFRYVNNVMFADGLQQFLESKVFKPWQLTIIPMQYNEAEKNGFRRASDAFWDVLGVTHGNPHKEVEIANWRDHHEAVKEELSPILYRKVNDVLEQIAGAHVVAKIIANAWSSGSGPLLYGYKGNVTSEANIAAWLKNGW